MIECNSIKIKGISGCNFYPKSRIVFDEFPKQKLKDVINKKWFCELSYTKNYISQSLIINAYRIIL